MSATNSRIAPALPEFPFSLASVAPAAQLCTLPSRSKFVTTVVSDRTSSPVDAIESSHSSDQEDAFLDAQQELVSEFASTRTTPYLSPSASIVVEVSHADDIPSKAIPILARSIKKATSFAKVLSLLSSRNVLYKGPPAIDAGNVFVPSLTPQTERSTWRRVKRMANKFAAPFRSIKYCTNAGCVAMGLCNDFSSGNSSPRFSCSSGGEYSPEFIRSTLENNMLLNHVSLR